MDQLIETFECVRLHRYNRHTDSNVSVDPLGEYIELLQFIRNRFETAAIVWLIHTTDLRLPILRANETQRFNA